MRKARLVMVGIAAAAMVTTGAIAGVNAYADTADLGDNPDGVYCERWEPSRASRIGDTDLTLYANVYTKCQLGNAVHPKGHLGGAVDSVDPFTRSQIDAAIEHLDGVSRGGANLYLYEYDPSVVCFNEAAFDVTGVGAGATDLGPALSAAYKASIRDGVRKLHLGLRTDCA